MTLPRSPMGSCVALKIKSCQKGRFWVARTQSATRETPDPREEGKRKQKNPFLLSQVFRLACTLNSFSAQNAHSTFTSPIFFSLLFLIFLSKHSGSNPVQYSVQCTKLAEVFARTRFVLSVLVCLYSVYSICKFLLPVSESKTSEQG